MRRISICLFLFFFCWARIFAQQKNEIGEFQRCKESRITVGSCSNVIKFLRIYQDNDSIAIEIFKDEYEIDNMPYRQQEWLFNKNYTEIVQYFTREENRKYLCRSKIFKYVGPVLLLD